MVILRNGDTAKSDYFCDSYAFFQNEGVRASLYFYEKGASFEKAWEPMPLKNERERLK